MEEEKKHKKRKKRHNADYGTNWIVNNDDDDDSGDSTGDSGSTGGTGTGSSGSGGGSATARVLTASKLHDFLRNPKYRPDLQDQDSQDFLDTLEDYLTSRSVDKILPWVVREWQKGRISRINTGKGGLLEYNGIPISVAEMNKLGDWAKAKRPDIMGFTWSEAKAQAGKWHDELAKKERETNKEGLLSAPAVYHFDDGWKMHQLLDEGHIRAEGHGMKSCLKEITNSAGYMKDISDGAAMIYSLRDSQGNPHMTVHMEPTHGHYDYKSAVESARKAGYLDGPKDYWHEMGAIAPSHDNWEHVAATLKAHGYSPDEISQFEHVWSIAPYHPSLVDAKVSQIQGKANNEQPNQKCLDKVNEWLSSYTKDRV